MAWVRLIEDYEDNKAGEVVNLPAVIARDLCHQGKAADGKAVSEGWSSYESATVDYEKREVKKKDTVIPDKLKPLDGTVKEIKAWLDENDINYPSQALKSELIKILKNA